jgi:hypothetical protein
MKNIVLCLAIVIVTVIGTLAFTDDDQRIFNVDKVVKSIVSFLKLVKDVF